MAGNCVRDNLLIEWWPKWHEWEWDRVMRAQTLPSTQWIFHEVRLQLHQICHKWKGTVLYNLLSASCPRLCWMGWHVVALVSSYRGETSAGTANTEPCLPSITPAKPPSANTVKQPPFPWSAGFLLVIKTLCQLCANSRQHIENIPK